LTILVDSLVNIGPAPLTTDIRLINAPCGPNRASMEAGSLAKQRQETLDPSVDGAAVHDETSLREPSDDIGVAHTIADIPVNRQSDDIVEKAMMGKGTG